ncbi:tyrosine-type recombinase/integrase, partial [Nonomuraea zeae]
PGSGCPQLHLPAATGSAVKVFHLHSTHRASRRTHDLRHTFASTALAEGVPISEVSRWLGHKSIITTVDLYGHLVPEATGRARDALDKAFKLALHVPEMCPR